MRQVRLRDNLRGKLMYAYSEGVHMVEIEAARRWVTQVYGYGQRGGR